MQKIHVVTAGKLEPWLESQFREYEKRLSRTMQLVWRVGKTSDVTQENEFFISQLKGKPYIALDESGIAVSSVEIAKYFEDSAVSARSDLYFLIGGAYGIQPSLLEEADDVWSFGKITLPHLLARLLLLEQIYRADSINQSSKYHH
jgi:23S rRNA (pseudouridine1915-N3)-methyltransferase